MKNIFFMGSSTAIRLVFGLLTFTILARLLGPASFGLFMFWLSIATLLGLVANYGFTPYLLREIGVKPDSAHTVMSEVLSAKILVSIALVIVAVCAMPIIDAENRWVFFILMLSILTDSTTDFLNVGYRATNRYAVETRIATIASAAQFAIVAGAIWYHPTVLIAAISFLISRICVLAMTWYSQAQYFANLQPAAIPRAVFRLKKALSYATDFALQSLFGQIDSVVLNYFLGPVAVGLHQAGMRLVLGGSQAANVLGNVFIPRISAVIDDPTKLQYEGQRLQTAFIASGMIFGLVLAVASEPIVHILFGKQFIALANLLPWFGLLFFVRFLASAWGIMLTSAGRQTLRAKANLMHWIVILLTAWSLVPAYGNVGWIISLTIGNLLLAAVYFTASYSLVQPTRSNTLITIAGAGAFLPFLHFS
ncbi:oligosaccharide flippase family protein [Sulfuriferula thiophila]|uniref:oligosaccharide flippase family protein n=1 Tax=Sulfuriferula thiophila TaxID=1781211 RepID=UPI000F60A8B8|nr:oligosaccharide flippase family protein [Sulfuriferula thiophila]